MRSTRFHFDGGAATFVGTALLGLLITVGTLGICYPFALVLNERWRAKHSYIDGFQLRFTGSAIGLFGNWLKWLFLSVITLGVYLLWVIPRIQRWKWQHTEFDQASPPLPLVSVHAVGALPQQAPNGWAGQPAAFTPVQQMSLPPVGPLGQ